MLKLSSIRVPNFITFPQADLRVAIDSIVKEEEEKTNGYNMCLAPAVLAPNYYNNNVNCILQNNALYSNKEEAC